MLCSADFVKALAVRPCAKSTHFAVHHVPWSVSLPKASPAPKADLSTGVAPNEGVAVDESLPLPDRIDLGLVVPKRHARRAVTRNLVKRHIRSTFSEQVRQSGLRPGGWVVRLRSPFDKARFGSAKSAALAALVRAELLDLLMRASSVRAG